ncbi:sugar transferase [Elioraea sp.]|uniref:sugar transferase n=1 Tax=Elioraea sp. TaxID=2185103 RepID=UPI003F71E6CC
MLSAEARDNLTSEAPIATIEPLQLSLAPTLLAPPLTSAANDLGPACPVPQRRIVLREAAKRTLDIAGAAMLLVLFAPLMAVIALLIARDGGPVLYAHRRVGRDGASFGCLKFRSMVVDADLRLAELLERDPVARAEWETTRKLRRDPRVTAVGRFLRASSLDELPQLINVLKGEMSLVGPRPVQQSELNAFYGAAASYYRAVRPGLTGPWQVSGRNDTSYADRVALDVRYVAEASLLDDIRILLRTPFAVLRRRGAY